MLTLIKAWDQALFSIVNQWHHPLLDHFFSWITHTFFWLPLYVFLLFFISKNLGWRGLVLFIFTLVLSDQCAAGLLRPLLGRLRPCYALNLPFVRLIGPHEGMFGFPSAHASNTFSFALLFWKIFKEQYKHTYLFFIWAAIISYGRIYGGMHYPLDVVCGALLGASIGLGMCKLYQKKR